MAELFWPSKIHNRKTSAFCKKLAVGVATTLLTELAKHNQAVVTKEEKLATVGVRANSDPSEGGFAALTDILHVVVVLAYRALQALVRFDTIRYCSASVTGRCSKLVRDNYYDDGLFHQLPDELTDSLLSMAKRHSALARKDFQVGLEMHSMHRKN
jgi:hypothetical protein